MGKDSKLANQENNAFVRLRNPVFLQDDLGELDFMKGRSQIRGTGMPSAELEPSPSLVNPKSGAHQTNFPQIPVFWGKGAFPQSGITISPQINQV